MDKIPILKVGSVLLITVQVDLNERMTKALLVDLGLMIRQTNARGVLIDISAVEIVDSFMGKMIGSIAKVSKILDAQTVVVGMKPAVAITLIELGVPLSGVVTALDVQKGMAIFDGLI